MLYKFSHYWIARKGALIAIFFSFPLFAWQYSAPLFLLPPLLIAGPVLIYFPLRSQLHLAGVLFLLFSLYFFLYSHPTLPKQGVTGTMHLSITSVKEHPQVFSKKKILLGWITHFETKAWKNLPVTVEYSGALPSFDTDYKVHGQLTQIAPLSYRLLLNKEEKWKTIPHTLSMSGWRIRNQKAISQNIRALFPDETQSDFLTGIFTGQFPAGNTKHLFRTLGLSHLLAISGFHFGIMIALLSTLFSPLFKKYSLYTILMVLMTGYFMLIGPSPSVLRAWVMTLLTLFALLTARFVDGQNFLGIAIITSLFFDPTVGGNYGFILTFLITWSILLWYPLFMHMINPFFLKREKIDLCKWTLTEQILYIVTQFFKNAAALLLAVNITALPLSLHLFSSFSLTGLGMNLIIPVFVAFCLFFLILTLAISQIYFPIAQLLAPLTSFLTNYTLHLVESVPNALTFNIIYTISDTLTVVIITCTSLIGILIRGSQKNRAVALNYF